MSQVAGAVSAAPTTFDYEPKRGEFLEKTPSKARWRMPWMSLGLTLLLLMGFSIALYPSVASWLSQYYQSQLIVEVTGTQTKRTDPELAAEIQRARDYNDLLIGGALVAANTNKPQAAVTSTGEVDYFSLLNATSTGVMGRLRIPSIQVDLPIYHGTDDYTLTKGVGHLQGTSLPVAGASQHSVLTAHRGLPEATLFDNLDKVNVGDTFTVEVFGEVFTYQVIETQIVEPHENQALAPIYGRDLVTLVTCTPLGINTHRILVTAERVTPTPIKDVEASGTKPEIPGFPWWAVIFGGAVLSGIGYVWRSGYPKDVAKPRRSEL